MALHVIAELKVTDTTTPERTRQALAELVTQTVTEPGCIRFEISQSSADPDVFFLAESWVDQAALDSHLAADYTQAYLATGMTELIQHHVVTPVG